MSLVLSILVGSVGLGALRFSVNKYHDVYQENGNGRAFIYEMEKDVLMIKDVLSKMICATDTSKLDAMSSSINEYKDTISESYDLYMNSIVEYSEDKKMMQELNNNLNTLYGYCEQIKNLANKGDLNAMFELYSGELSDVYDSILQSLDEEIEWQKNNGIKKEKNVERFAYTSRIVILLMMIAVVFIDIISARKIVDKIDGPINNLLKSAESLANGDLTSEFMVLSDDELGDVSKLMNKVVKNSKDAMLEIEAVTNQVNDGAREISNSSQTLSEGATEQASALEQLSSSVETIYNKTKLNAENSAKAKNLVDITRESALVGSSEMDKMVQATEEIQKASSDIQHIIETIDNIAFQTNILALNAAVEAARAGIHGKGFAVVADEVRTLAVRSADAVKETSELIQNSIEKTNRGAELALSASESFSKIVSEVTNITELINEIAEASNEQAGSVEEINIGLSQVNDGVQTTSATSEETAAASEELSTQVEILTKQLEYFKVR